MVPGDSLLDLAGADLEALVRHRAAKTAIAIEEHVDGELAPRQRLLHAKQLAVCLGGQLRTVVVDSDRPPRTARPPLGERRHSPAPNGVRHRTCPPRPRGSPEERRAGTG